MVTQSYKISTVRSATPPLVKMSQYDHDSRTIVFTVVDSTGANVTLTGYTVMVEGERIDGHAFATTCTVSGATATFTETVDMTNASGQHPAELVVSNGSKRLGTMNFMLDVEPCAMPEDSTITEEDKTLFQQLYDKLAAGSPVVVDTVAEMTDTEAAYLYTGTETGYTAGNWYYYNGSAWVSGGAYGSVFNPDGTYPGLTAGQLYTENGVENVEPYLFRAVPAAASEARMRKLVGGTLAWNQLVPIAGTSRTTTFNDVTLTDNRDGSYTLNGTASASGSIAFTGSNTVFIPINHVFFMFGFREVSGAYAGLAGLVIDRGNGGIWKNTTTHTSLNGRVDFAQGTNFQNVKIYPQLFDLTQMFGTTIADYIYTLESGTAGAGVAWFKKYFPEDYYAYNAGELKSVEGVSAKVTTGKNLMPYPYYDDRTSIVGVSVSYNSDGSVTLNGTATGTFYLNFGNADNNNVPFKAGTYTLSGGTASSSHFRIVVVKNNTYFTATGNKTITFTLEEDSLLYFYGTATSGQTFNNETFYPQVEFGSAVTAFEKPIKHTYPLDSTLTLRGIPKLDGNNNLYYDGDTYEYDGTVTRKYGVVDLGTLTWSYTTYFQANVQIDVPTVTQWVVQNGICAKYSTREMFYVINDAQGIDKSIAWYSSTIRVRDSSYTDAATFKTAMSGVYLVYEFATPTTETADPFTESQIVDPYGTEEFVSTGIVPVGHDTLYVDDLKQRLEDIAPPTTDGTYTLQVTVSGGRPTFAWVAATD